MFLVIWEPWPSSLFVFLPDIKHIAKKIEWKTCKDVFSTKIKFCLFSSGNIPILKILSHGWGKMIISGPFFGLQNHCSWWLQSWNWKTLAPWKKSYEQPRQHIKKQRRYFANKGPSSQSYVFSSSHVWMWVGL